MKRQVTGVGSGIRDALVMRGRFVPGDHDALDHDVDADETDLRDVEASDADLGDTLAAADIENPIAGTRSQRFHQEFGEVIVPPPLA